MMQENTGNTYYVMNEYNKSIFRHRPIQYGGHFGIKLLFDIFQYDLQY